jgi:hypothetical protein
MVETRKNTCKQLEEDVSNPACKLSQNWPNRQCGKLACGSATKAKSLIGSLASQIEALIMRGVAAFAAINYCPTTPPTAHHRLCAAAKSGSGKQRRTHSTVESSTDAPAPSKQISFFLSAAVGVLLPFLESENEPSFSTVVVWSFKKANRRLKKSRRHPREAPSDLASPVGRTPDAPRSARRDLSVNLPGH